MKKGDVVKVAVPIIVAVVAIGVAAYWSRSVPTRQACTDEAMLCPDGSAVGRTGPNCAFAPCPGGGGPTCGSTYGSCTQGYECIQRCGPPVAREDDPDPGYHCAPIGQPQVCPICLASNAMIATPWGEVDVKTLQPGDVVWSVEPDGKKMAQPLVAVAKTPVGSTHRVVDLKLSDGRELFVSPNHPTADGRLVGDLKTGDAFDGADVLSAESVPYWDDATYDLLPEGETGYYWANGVLLESTLKK